ncbi:MAG: ATP-binding protein, partial [Patescibacteria group bacterium]
MSKKIDKNEILAVLNDWNFWQHSLPVGIRRDDYLTKAKSFLRERQILIIAGARRSGKSFIMRQVIKELTHSGVPAQETLMINFEDPRLPKLGLDTLQDIYEIYLEALNPKASPYLFLDEIQEVEGWEKWVRTIHELGKAHLIISGSNAKLLSQELATLLTGRHLDVEVSPLSFKEFLSFKQFTVKNKLDLIGKQIEIKRLFSEYFKYGGFPEVVLSNNKEEVLLRYFDDILNKDLIKRYRIRKIAALKSLTKFYLSNISSS